MKHWIKFAEMYNLKYYPGSFFGESGSVEGTYGGYRFRLEKITVDKQEGTRISVLGESTRNPVPARTVEKESDCPDSAEELINKLVLLEEQYGRKPGIRLEHDSYNGNLYYEQQGLLLEVDVLKHRFDMMCEFASLFIASIRMGGELFFPLNSLIQERNNALKEFIIHMMRYIANGSLAIWSNQPHVCSRCLTYFNVTDISVSWFKKISFYGCRTCNTFDNPLNGTPVAVLDAGMKERFVQQDSMIRVNYIQMKQLFDFKRIEIINAADDDVERFIIAVNNDADSFRQRLLSNDIPCVLSPECNLSVNTMRILGKTFPSVSRKQ